MTPSLPPVSVLRAIDDLRRRMGIVITKGAAFTSYFPLESDAPVKTGHAILTGARAKYLGLISENPAAICIEANDLSAAQLKYLADPLAEKTPLPKLDIQPAQEMDVLALTLAKYASLLPALFKIDGVADDAGQKISFEEMKSYVQNPPSEVEETARAHLPVDGAETAQLASFRTSRGAGTHLALIVGDITAAKNPLARVHSSCVTGDILGSLRCDCGSQLQMALKAIIAEGAGVLVYLHQEGRGIGIANKLRAYALQEQGADTFEANQMLGFEEDERDFSLAAAILKKLGLKNCRLLTNNPHKMESLKQLGIAISERVPLAVESGRHNHAYLNAKAKKSGHLF